MNETQTEVKGVKLSMLKTHKLNTASWQTLFAFGVLFTIDLLIPTGVAMGGLYLCFIALLIKENKKIILFFSTLATFLILLKLVLLLTSTTPAFVFINRGISVAAVWVTCYIALRHKKLDNDLVEINQTLEKRVEERSSEILETNRLYRFISAINQSIVHTKDKKELFDNACKIATEVGGFNLAWIGLLDEQNKLNVAAKGGHAQSMQSLQRFSGADFSTEPGLSSPPRQSAANGPACSK
ncbi:hypothetical protein BH11BAC1_BH11BAC1_12370 [soil metagenome]